MSRFVGLVTRSLRRVARAAPVRAVRDTMRWRSFCSAGNGFWGVYASFKEAEADVPSGGLIGYDNDAAADLYRWKLDFMEPSDYAVLYWLERALTSGARVFDFGGHVGLKYYSFRSVGALNDPLTWTVYDVPAVVRAGRVLAQEKGASALAFTETADDASGADVWLALGSAQFVEAPIYSYLERLSRRPREVIISKSPMVEGPRFVTLHTTGTMFCPYLIENVADVIANMERIGYQLLHRWKNDEKWCQILNRPDKSLYHYTTLHFALRSGEPAR